MMNDQFLKNIHKKIKRKQNFNYGLTFVFSVTLMFVMTFTSMKFIDKSKMEYSWKQFEEVEFAQDSFEWEKSPEISQDEIKYYLLEELDLYNFIEELSEEEQHILIIKIKLEG
jgi:hypothetical protein